MKNSRTVGLVAMLVLLWAVPSMAQVTINSTTFSSAVASTDNVVNIASATCTGCTFGSGVVLFADGEVMTVAPTYVSGTTNIPVIRTNQRANHASGAAVFLGPPGRFQRTDPPFGACIKTTLQYYPWLNMTNGWEWLCDSGQSIITAVTWRALVPYTFTSNSR